MNDVSIFDKKGLFIYGPKEEIFADLDETENIKKALENKNDFLLIGRHSGYISKNYIWAGFKLEPQSSTQNSVLLFWNKIALKYSANRCTHFLNYNHYIQDNFNQYITIAIKVDFDVVTFDDFLKQMFDLSGGLELTYCQIKKQDDRYEAFIVLIDKDLNLLKEYEKQIRDSKLFVKNEKTCVNVYFYQQEECFRIINSIRELEPFALRKENQI